MGRIRASLIHLAISFVVIASIVLLVLWLWYPQALLRMSGTGRIIGILAGVDIVAGPLLTLIVYRAGKPSLRFDLTVIALLQAGLLGYGLWTLAQGRPVYMVGAVDRIELVRAADIAPADLAEAAPGYGTLSWTGPRWVGIEVGDTPEARARALEDSLSGRDLPLRPRYYVPFAQVADALMARSRPLDELLPRLGTSDRERIERAVQGVDPAPARYLPVNSPFGAALGLVGDTGEVVRLVDVDPWP
ncbi:MAG: TfpX/TfpZ family type IV pilin accessory protein [Pseudoxanthomonas sp.]|nr:TfpX/TfpZ family type IV pilin accessory protein [Pseudoxanthomonas sp.]